MDYWYDKAADELANPQVLAELIHGDLNDAWSWDKTVKIHGVAYEPAAALTVAILLPADQREVVRMDVLHELIKARADQLEAAEAEDVRKAKEDMGASLYAFYKETA